MHLLAALACAAGGLAIGPALAGVVADPPLREPSDERGLSLEGRALVLVTAGLTALLLGLAGWRIGFSLDLVPVLVLFAGLVVVSLVDLMVFRIPDKVLLPVGGICFLLILGVSLVRGEPDAVLWAVVGALVAFFLLGIPFLVYPAGMGFGDVKLAALMGLFCGWLGWTPDLALDAVRLTLVALIIGSVIGVVAGLGVTVVRRKRSPFPFGPALAVATVVAVLWAEPLLAR